MKIWNKLTDWLSTLLPEDDTCKILPPVRQPNKPHWRRVEQVYECLERGQRSGLTTYSSLIEFVRLETGQGCSKKLVSKWKRNRQNHQRQKSPL